MKKHSVNFCRLTASVNRYLLSENVRFLFAIMIFILLRGMFEPTYGQPLAGTDELNRTLPQYTSVGGPVSNKSVAMFYFLWHGHPASPTSNYVYDLTEIVAAHPGVLNIYTDPNWGSTTPAYYFWGQSIYNYYNCA